MKIHFIKAALLLGLFTGGQAAAQSGPQSITIPLSRPGEPVHLEIAIVSAHIEVIGEDRSDASFEVSVVDGQRKIVTPSGTQLLKSGSYSLEVEEEDNHIKVGTDWSANKVRVLARIPRQAKLELSTVNDGVIEVSNITGQLWLENTNGPITATGINGSVVADSVNRDIRVNFESVDPAQPMSFTSVNGSLLIGWPEDAGAELHIDSAQGKIYSDYEVDVQPTEPVIRRENGQNGVEVRVESVIVAKINGGGSVVRLKTLNGDIRIEKAN